MYSTENRVVWSGIEREKLLKRERSFGRANEGIEYGCICMPEQFGREEKCMERYVRRG